jgi:hypothetical protein
MRGRPPPGPVLALAVAKSLVLLAVGALCFGVLGDEPARTATPQPPVTRVDVHRPAAALLRAMDRHDCSEAGFDAAVRPRSALIRRQGAIHHVSFDEGWAVFTDRRPGRLLALCLDAWTPPAPAERAARG